jgi:hypothetical protein
MFGAQGQGLAVIFSHHQLPLVCVKKKKGGHVLGSKVKVEFRHLFFHFENGLVFGLPIKLMQISFFFADLLVYSGITLVFKFQAVRTTSYHSGFYGLNNKVSFH